MNTLELALLIAAAVIAAISIFETRGHDLPAWAALLICAALILPRI